MMKNKNMCQLGDCQLHTALPMQTSQSATLHHALHYTVRDTNTDLPG